MSHLVRLKPVPLSGLTLMWCLLWGSVSPAMVFYGLVVSAVILWAFPMPPMASTLRPHPLGVLRLGLRFGWDLITASCTVAALTLRPRAVGPGSLVDVRLRLDDDLRRTIVAEMTSLVPGTVVIDLDAETSLLTLHILDRSDAATAERERERVRALEDRVERAFSVRDRRPDECRTQEER